MMSECMLKKKKAMMDVKQHSPFSGGVLTRSMTLSLQKESGQFGSRRFNKLAAASAASGEVKKRQRRGENGSLLKGERRSGRKRKAEVVGEVNLGEGEKGKGDLVGGGVLDSIGVVADTLIGGGDGGGGAKGGDGGEGAEEGGDSSLGDDVLVTAGNDRVTRESTPEHLIIKSDYIRTLCSSMKGAKAVADERPQIEVGGNLTQHKKLTTDLLLQDNSNYAPSMEKYNFDFENEKPLPGRFEWEKIQP